MTEYKSSQSRNEATSPVHGNAEVDSQASREALRRADENLLSVCAVQRRDHDAWVTRIAEYPLETLALDAEMDALLASWQSALHTIETLTPQTPLGALEKAAVARRYAEFAPSDGRSVSLLASSSEALGHFLSSHEKANNR